MIGFVLRAMIVMAAALAWPVAAASPIVDSNTQNEAEAELTGIWLSTTTVDNDPQGFSVTYIILGDGGYVSSSNARIRYGRIIGSSGDEGRWYPEWRADGSWDVTLEMKNLTAAEPFVLTRVNATTLRFDMRLAAERAADPVRKPGDPLPPLPSGEPGRSPKVVECILQQPSAP